MPTTYTPLLGLALPATGELSGTWGSTVNTEITSLLDTAVAGTTTLSTDADVTLSTTTGAANQARQAIILWTANGTVTRNITAPAASKTYVVINASAGTQSIVFRGVGPTAGVTVVKGESAVVAWNGSDFIKVSNTSGAGAFTNLSVSGTTTLSGLTASTALALDASKNVVSVTNTGTGNNVLATSPVLTTPNLGTPSAITLTNATGLPVSTGISGLGAGVATALAVSTGAAGAFVVNGGALGTPSSGTVTNLTGTASININGTVGATTPNTGAFTTLSASGVATFSAGTAAAPALTTIGDTDTGVFFPAANTWAVATGGVQALAVDPSGGLAVRGSATFGSTTVAGNTQINLASGTTDYTGFTRYSNGLGEIRHFGTAAFQLVTHNAADILFYANNSERMRITSAGDVGIGTSSPAAKLDIVTGTNRGYFDDSAGSLFRLNAVNAANSAYAPLSLNGSVLTFQIAASERMRIDSAGNVGIGTTGPTSGIELFNASGQTTAAITTGTNVGSFITLRHNSAAAGAGGGVIFGAQGGNFAAIKGLLSNGSNNTTGDLAFSTRRLSTDAALTECMRIDASGNVGIGTAAPLQPLHVIGNGRFQGNIFNVNGFATVDLLESATGVGFRWALANNGTFRLQRSANGTYSDATTPILFDASGNVGIGTTTPAVRLDVAEADITQLRVEAKTNGVDTRLSSLGLSANAGVVGTYSNHPLAVFTNSQERMRINASGNVGIGTNNPGYALTVANGDIGVKRSATNDGAIFFGSNTDNYIYGGNASNILTLATNNSERVRVKSAGQVRFVPLAADPGNAESGDVYYNSGTNKLRVYNGTTWENLH